MAFLEKADNKMKTTPDRAMVLGVAAWIRRRS